VWISLKETIALYRQRLYDISWLMASLSEPIARQAKMTAIVGIPNKHSNIQTFHYFVLFLIKEDETYLEISV
jgi:hypothetical protein